ncbi:hypothetical protein Tco_0174933 [Tanacetum coccineum]
MISRMCPWGREHIKQEINNKELCLLLDQLTDTGYSISLNTSYRRFDTSYPTGGYGVSGDQSEQNSIQKRLNARI